MEGRKVIALLLLGLFFGSCSEHKTSIPNEAAPVISPPVQSQSIKPQEKISSFVQVKSMLSRNCTPCHEPGGKMYEKLPFDNPEVIRANSAPILRRINKPEDKRLMEDWLSEPVN